MIAGIGPAYRGCMRCGGSAPLPRGRLDAVEHPGQGQRVLFVKLQGAAPSPEVRRHRTLAEAMLATHLPVRPGSRGLPRASGIGRSGDEDREPLGQGHPIADMRDTDYRDVTRRHLHGALASPLAVGVVAATAGSSINMSSPSG